MSLLDAEEPSAYQEFQASGSSDFLIVVDHAGARIPRKLGSLGLAAEELKRHIAWDIGALGVARHLARILDAHTVSQTYSRLVIDCNRDPKVPSSIPRISELHEIPGNIDLSAEDIAARRREIFDPYHARIRELIDVRRRASRPVFLVAQHTMTDIYKGVRRNMHAAVLYNRDPRFAGLVLERLRREPDLVVADNEPYFVSDETDYTIPHHGEGRALPHVEIEIRQDLVNGEKGQAEWGERIAAALTDARKRFDATFQEAKP